MRKPKQMLGDKNKACRQLVCTNKEKLTDNSFNRVTQIEIDSSNVGYSIFPEKLIILNGFPFFRRLDILKHIADQNTPSSMKISN